MHRLFVAIRPPASVRAQLRAAMGGIAGARWQSDDQLHLTLRFIGEVDRHRADDVHAALGAVHYARFGLALAGVGSFERRGDPIALWAGVAPQEPLRNLHKKIDQALVRAGVAPDRRTYVPHVTLARLPRNAGPVGPFLQAAGPLAGPLFTVEDFCLYESGLTPEGAVYTIVERYSLG
ncbi:MAG: thpR [Alphaproteobacteria bacterium]|nr:thpR [Alphaproteobacteria bacterium]